MCPIQRILQIFVTVRESHRKLHESPTHFELTLEILLLDFHKAIVGYFRRWIPTEGQLHRLNSVTLPVYKKKNVQVQMYPYEIGPPRHLHVYNRAEPKKAEIEFRGGDTKDNIVKNERGEGHKHTHRCLLKNVKWRRKFMPSPFTSYGHELPDKKINSQHIHLIP